MSDDPGDPGPPSWGTVTTGMNAPGTVIDITPTFDVELERAPASAGEASAEDPDAPSTGIRERWSAIARMHALGMRNSDIAERLGYTQSRISIVLNEPWIQKEIARYRSKFESDVTERIKDAAIDGAHFVHTLINNGSAREQTRLDAAKWAIEKTTGKAKQEVSVESNTLTNFMQLMRDMQAQGELAPRPMRDVAALGPGEPTPAEGDGADAPQPDQWSTWIGTNL